MDCTFVHLKGPSCFHPPARQRSLSGVGEESSSGIVTSNDGPTVRPARGPTAVSARARNGFPPAARIGRLVPGRNKVGDRLQRFNRETVPQIKQRLTSAEGHIEGLQRWRVSFTAALPQTPVTPAEPVAGPVPARWDAVDTFFPFVSSIRSRTHKVSAG